MCVEMQDLIYRSLIEVVQAGRNRVSESLVVCVGMYSTGTVCCATVTYLSSTDCLNLLVECSPDRATKNC
jgi:hypothetical protein